MHLAELNIIELTLGFTSLSEYLTASLNRRFALV